MPAAVQSVDLKPRLPKRANVLGVGIDDEGTLTVILETCCDGAADGTRPDAPDDLGQRRPLLDASATVRRNDPSPQSWATTPSGGGAPPHKISSSFSVAVGQVANS